MQLTLFWIDSKAKSDSLTRFFVGSVKALWHVKCKLYFRHVTYERIKIRLAGVHSSVRHARAKEVKTWHKVNATHSSNWSDRIERSVCVFLALMCLRSPISVECVILTVREKATQHHSLLLLLIVPIVKIDTDNRSTWVATYPTHYYCASLSFIRSMQMKANKPQTFYTQRQQHKQHCCVLTRISFQKRNLNEN